MSLNSISARTRLDMNCELGRKVINFVVYSILFLMSIAEAAMVGSIIQWVLKGQEWLETSSSWVTFPFWGHGVYLYLLQAITFLIGFFFFR